MKIEHGSNLPRSKKTNQSAIRRMIYLYGPITRTEIARKLDLTLPTITTNVNSLLSNGLIRELDEKIPNADGVAGRKSTLLQIVPESRYFIGVEIFRKYRSASIVDYKANAVRNLRDEQFISNYEDLILSASCLVNSLLESQYVPRCKIYGIGISMPGIVDTENGVLYSHRQYNFYDKNVVDDIRKQINTDLPVYLENDAAARAIRYSLQNKKNISECGVFAYLFVQDGISCPIMMNNPNFISSCIGPGELSYMILEAGRPMGRNGSDGMLSNLAGMRATIERCVDSNIPEILEILDSGCKVTGEDILRLQRNGNERIHQIISESVNYIGIALANIDNIVRPDSIIVEGSFFENRCNRENLVSSCKEYLFRKDDDINIKFIDTDEFTGAASAASVAIQEDMGDYIGL